MNRALWSLCVLSLCLGPAACGDDDDDGGGSSSGTPGNPNDGGSTESTGGGGDGDTGDAGDDGDGSTDTGGDTGDDGDTGGSGGTGGDDGGTSGGDATTGNPCDPVVPGYWNACINENGQVDNTLCEWQGSGDSVGMVGCLTAADNEDANVCFISDCEDVCDCFAPPATGNAPIICDEILAGGGMGCALDCSNGETCPDDMECISSLCFWPPP
jgi:hypothetical protein